MPKLKATGSLPDPASFNTGTKGERKMDYFEASIIDTFGIWGQLGLFALLALLWVATTYITGRVLTARTNLLLRTLIAMQGTTVPQGEVAKLDIRPSRTEELMRIVAVLLLVCGMGLAALVMLWASSSRAGEVTDIKAAHEWGYVSEGWWSCKYAIVTDPVFFPDVYNKNDEAFCMSDNAKVDAACDAGRAQLKDDMLLDPQGACYRAAHMSKFWRFVP